MRFPSTNVCVEEDVKVPRRRGASAYLGLAWSGEVLSRNRDMHVYQVRVKSH